VVDRQFFKSLLLASDPRLADRLDALTDAQMVREVEQIFLYATSKLAEPARLDSDICRCDRCGIELSRGLRRDSNGYQPSCPYCIRKHLASAAAWIREANRYPERAFEAEGELTLAANECSRSWPHVADDIEKARIRLTNEDIVPRQEQFYDWLDEIDMLNRTLVFEETDDDGTTHQYPCDYPSDMPEPGGLAASPDLASALLGL